MCRISIGIFVVFFSFHLSPFFCFSHFLFRSDSFSVFFFFFFFFSKGIRLCRRGSTLRENYIESRKWSTRKSLLREGDLGGGNDPGKRAWTTPGVEGSASEKKKRRKGPFSAFGPGKGRRWKTRNKEWRKRVEIKDVSTAQRQRARNQGKRTFVCLRPEFLTRKPWTEAQTTHSRRHLIYPLLGTGG